MYVGIITGNVIGFSVETAVKDCTSSNYKKVHVCVVLAYDNNKD